MVKPETCVTCSELIEQVSFEGRTDLWIHSQTGDWITWKCPTGHWEGGLRGWWDTDIAPTCPQCHEPVYEDHQAEKRRWNAVINKINEFMMNQRPPASS